MDGLDPLAPTGDARLAAPSQDVTLLSLTPAASIGARTGHEPEISLAGERVRALMAPKYTTTKVLGRGGMGEVALGLDRDLRRQVAVKTLLRLDDSRAMARFIEEAQVTGQLEHPNIVPVHELGIDDAHHPFLVMKRVKGRDLAAVLDAVRHGLPTGLHVDAVPATMRTAPSVDPYGETMTDVRSHSSSRRSRVSSARMRGAKTSAVSGRNAAARAEVVRPEGPTQALTRLLDVFAKTCDAVAYAHSRGVIHRDLKPENIMVGEFGEVLVMDWGLAKVIGRPDSHHDRLVITDRSDDPNAIRTADGAVAGTPMYMSPEQARGEIDALDERSDVYALGAILYEILSLKRPYDADTVYALLGQVARGLVKPMRPRSEAAWSIPRGLDAITMKAMSLKPHHRYATVLDLKADISAWQSSLPITARRDGPLASIAKWAKRHPTVALTSVLAVLFATVLSAVVAAGVANNEATLARLARGESERLKVEAEKAQAEREAERLGTLALLYEGRVDELIEQLGGKVRREFDEKVLEWQRLWDQRRDDFASLEAFVAWLGDTVNEYLDAFEALFRYAKQYPERQQIGPRDHFFRAFLRDATGDQSGALEGYSAAIALDPDYALAYYNRGLIRAARGRIDEAIDDYSEAIRVDPGYAFALNNRAWLLWKHRDDQQAALADFAAALRANPRLVAAHKNRALVWLKIGNHEAAIDDYNAVFRLEGVVDAISIMNRGVAFWGVRKLDAAIDDFTTAIELDREYADAYQNRGVAYRDRGDHEDAINDFTQAITLTDEPLAYCNRADTYRRLGRRNDAIADYSAAIMRAPDLIIAYFNRGVMLSLEGDYEASIPDFTKVLSAQPEALDALCERGRAYAMLGEPDRAIADYEAALRVDNEYVDAYERLGSVYYFEGDDEAAVRYSGEATRLDPQRWDAWLNLGRAQARLGNREAAVDAFDHALAVVPVNRRRTVELARQQALGD